MKKGVTAYILSLTAIVWALVSLSSCNLVEDKEMDIGNTVLIYIAADNNLASNARHNIEDLKTGDVPVWFNEGRGDVLLVYADIAGEVPRLMRISKDRYGAVATEVLMEYPDTVNSIAPEVMSEVLSYAASLFPSNRNGLVLWSHGTGWLPDDYYSRPYSSSGTIMPMSLDKDPYAIYVKSFGEDYDATENMDIKDIAQALPVHYSYILFDACLMGGVEVAYELKDCCDYLVSSSAEILAAGFPYKEVSGYLLDGSLSALKAMSDEYYRTYINDGATVSVVETKALDALASSVRMVLESGGADSIPELDMDSLQGYFRRLWNGHSYYEPHWFYDLGDFISKIAPDEASLDAFQAALESAVVYRRSTENFVLGNRVQFPIKTFSGLSTYVPNPENSYLDDYYRTLAWNQAVRMVR